MDMFVYVREDLFLVVLDSSIPVGFAEAERASERTQVPCHT